MNINWSGLGIVFVVALAAAVVLTGLFAYGVRGLSERVTARANGGTGTMQLTGAVVCFAVCAAVIGYGIYLIMA
ncbi:hypothetical protein [Amycolatopsis jejuensis]|uniref:hypothetical protein n=1 Tax=Amycolatopsis jejuensis TaxID=330084 RepID=UPI000524D75B|nr:hypothetical protein [Amycolatopsis jejuensis]